MRTSAFALGLLVLGLAKCGGDRGLLVGEERGGSGGSAANGGDEAETGGSGGANRGGSYSGGTSGDPGTTGGTGGDIVTGGTGGDPGSTGGTSGDPSTGGTSGDPGSTGGTSGDPSTGGTGGDPGSTGGTGGDIVTGGTGGDPGSTGGSAGTSRGGTAGASGSGGTTSETDCALLAREYRERLAASEQCIPTAAAQCTLEMPDDLLCGCPTYVNPARDSDIRRMNELLDLAVRCPRNCITVVCREVTRGVCGASTDVATSRGRCVGEP